MKPRQQPDPHRVIEDRGADGPASAARAAHVRAVEPGAGHHVASVRECLDVLAIDRLLLRGRNTEDEHAAGLVVARAWHAAGLHRQSTARYSDAGGGHEDGPGWGEWRALIDRVPDRCRVIVVSVCGAGQDPTSPVALATLRAGLHALTGGRARRA